MKALTITCFTLAAVVIARGSASAQTAQSVEQGANYAFDVFYSLDNGIVASVPADDWDIAFEVTNPFAIGIRINDGFGREIAVYPGGDLSSWDAVDSTGFSVWPKKNNGLDLWENGALNTGFSSNPMDFGWGVYSGPPLHQVVGDSLYVFKRADGSALKLRINDLTNGLWSFTYANLDGTNEVTATLAMGDYADRNYAYYHFTNGALDREPATTAWDLLFTRYMGPTQFGVFPTTGVLLNRDRAAAEADGVDVTTAVHTDYTLTADSIVALGNDWKSLVNFMWVIDPDRVYFVESSSGAIHSLYFTGFSGSSTGITTFNTEVASAVAVSEAQSPRLAAFPNPVSDGALYLAGCTETGVAEIFGLSGALVASHPYSTAGGAVALDVAALPAGTYVVRVVSGTETSSHRFVKL